LWAGALAAVPIAVLYAVARLSTKPQGTTRSAELSLEGSVALLAPHERTRP
jgi:hypothetical protein